MKARTVVDAWTSYRHMVIPASAPAVQLQECRRAFYAGAEMLMCEILQGLSPGPEAIESDMDFIAALHQELLRFAKDVKEGRA